jgi:CheY-like chemotaxis protein
MQRANFAPTVLLVDDDPNVTRRWTAEFHRRTSLGVLAANSLKQGREIFEDPEIKVDAIVADIYFDYGKDDPDTSLFDGLDLLAYLSKRGIRIPMFVVSAGIDMLNFKERAAREKIPIISYFDKFTAGDPEGPAWTSIQHSVLKEIFGQTSEITRVIETASSGNAPAIDVLNRALCDLQLPVRTYIQSFGRRSELSVLKPIEVICIAKSAQEVRAYAPSLGLLTSGCGEDIETAIDELKNALELEAETLIGLPPEKLSEYSAKVAAKLDEYLCRGSC